MTRNPDTEINWDINQNSSSNNTMKLAYNGQITLKEAVIRKFKNGDLNSKMVRKLVRTILRKKIAENIDTYRYSITENYDVVAVDMDSVDISRHYSIKERTVGIFCSENNGVLEEDAFETICRLEGDENSFIGIKSRFYLMSELEIQDEPIAKIFTFDEEQKDYDVELVYDPLRISCLENDEIKDDFEENPQEFIENNSVSIRSKTETSDLRIREAKQKFRRENIEWFDTRSNVGGFGKESVRWVEPSDEDYCMGCGKKSDFIDVHYYGSAYTVGSYIVYQSIDGEWTDCENCRDEELPAQLREEFWKTTDHEITDDSVYKIEHDLYTEDNSKSSDQEDIELTEEEREMIFE